MGRDRRHCTVRHWFNLVSTKLLLHLGSNTRQTRNLVQNSPPTVLRNQSNRACHETKINQRFCQIYHDEVGYSKRTTATVTWQTSCKVHVTVIMKGAERSGGSLYFFALKDEAHKIKRGEGSWKRCQQRRKKSSKISGTTGRIGFSTI